MEQPKEPPLDEQARRIRKGIVELAKKLRISREETIMLLAQRERVIANNQLTHLHEMMDLLLADIREIHERLREMLNLLRGKKAKGRGR